MAKSKIKRDDSSGAGGSGDWLNTYADMVTLLLTFFILLYSMSSVDPVKWDQLVQTYGVKNKSVSGIEPVDPVNLDQNALDTPVNPQQSSQDAEAAEINDIISDLVTELKFVGTANEDAEKIQDIMEKIEQAEYNFFTMYAVIQGYVESNNLSAKLQVSRDENFVIVRFKDKSLFDPGKASLKTESMEMLRYVTAAINLVLHDVDKIVVEGHTDNRPQNSPLYPDNWHLASARASNVVRVLLTYGLPPVKLKVEAFADTVPVDPLADNNSEPARAENRRVELKITRLKNEPDISEDDDPPLDPDEVSTSENIDPSVIESTTN